MVVRLPYGKKYIELTLPDNLSIDVIRGTDQKGIPDEVEGVHQYCSMPPVLIDKIFNMNLNPCLEGMW